MRSNVKLVLVSLISVLCIGCDQVTKSAAKRTLADSEPLSMLQGFIRLEYIENPGAFLGIGSGLSYEVRLVLFVGIAVLMLAAVVYLAARGSKARMSTLTASALLVGGAAGNIIDRISNDGRVVDFVSIGFTSVRTGIFNVADVAVMSGALLLFFSAFKDTGSQRPTAGPQSS